MGIVAGVAGDDVSVSELSDWPAPAEDAKLKLGAPLPVHAGATTEPPVCAPPGFPIA